MTEKSVTKANPVTGLTPSMAVAIFKRMYPGVPDIEIAKAGAICANYGLFPYANQVFIIPFKDKYVTVIGIKGLREMARNTGNSYTYLDGNGPRVMTEQEEIEVYGKVDPDYIRAIIKIKDSHNNVWPGYGNWRRLDTAYGQDKGNTPYNMAFIRAERNAIDRMAPGEFPDAEMVDSQFIETPVPQIVQVGEKQLAEKSEQEIKDFWPENQKGYAAELQANEEERQAFLKVDIDWLRESLKKLGSTEQSVLVHIAKTCMVQQVTLPRAIIAMTDKQVTEFVAEVQRRLDKQKI